MKLLYSSALLLALVCAEASSGLLNKQVKRVLTVTPGQLLEDTVATVSNKAANDSFEYVVTLHDDLLSFKASQTVKEKSTELLYRMDGKKAIVTVAIPPGETIELTLNIAFKSKFTSPLDRQNAPSRLSVLGLSPFFNSPYKTVKQRTFLKVHPDLELTKLDCPEPFNKEQQYCGTYENVQFSNSELLVQVKPKAVSLYRVNSADTTVNVHTNAKTMTVTELLSISHVGHELINDDFSRAALSNHLSRKDAKFIPMVPRIRLTLPWSARRFEVEDVLGLNWSFVRREDAKALVVYYDIQPRFPLISKWTCNFSIKYDCDLKDLQRGNMNYAFPSCSITDRSLIQSNSVSIILPEDADLGTHGAKRTMHFLSTLGEQKAEFPSVQSPTVSLSCTIPKYAKIRKPLVGIVLSIMIILIISYLSQSDPKRAELERLLEERKWLVLEGVDLAKMDAEIVRSVHEIDSAAAESAMFVLQKTVTHLNIDKIGDQIRQLVE